MKAQARQSGLRRPGDDISGLVPCYNSHVGMHDSIAAQHAADGFVRGKAGGIGREAADHGHIEALEEAPYA